MSSLAKHFAQLAKQSISPNRKASIQHAVFSHIRRASYPRSWLLSRIQTYIESHRYMYMWLVCMLIVLMWNIFQINIPVGYQERWPTIRVSSPSSLDQAHADDMGKILTTMGEVNIVHKGRALQSSQLYGWDTLLLSNQSYVVFMLGDGYVWYISWPAKIELHKQDWHYYINVIQGTIFSIKWKSKMAQNIAITTRNVEIKPQGSVDLVIAHHSNQTLVQNKSNDQIIIKNQKDHNVIVTNPEPVIITSKQTISVSNSDIDQYTHISVISPQEAKMLIAQIQDSQVSSSYVIDSSLFSGDILSGIQMLAQASTDITDNLRLLNKDFIINNTQTWSSSSEVNSLTQALSTQKNQQKYSDSFNMIYAGDKKQDVIWYIFNQTNDHLKHIEHTYIQDTTSDMEIQIPQETYIKPLLKSSVSMQITNSIIYIRNQIDGWADQPNIDLINEQLMSIKQSLMINISPITTISQLSYQINIIQKELNTYTLDPKLTYNINRLWSSYRKSPAVWWSWWESVDIFQGTKSSVANERPNNSTWELYHSNSDFSPQGDTQKADAIEDKETDLWF